MRKGSEYLRWFSHVERLEDNRLTRKMYELEIQGPRCRGRPRKGWVDGVIKVLCKMDLMSKKRKNACKIRENGTMYIGWRTWCW